MTTLAQLEAAFQYAWSIAPSEYVHWYSGDVSLYDGPPAWAVSAAAPDASYVQPQGGFCVAVLNLILRKLGLPIPNPFNDPANDGGTYSTYWAYYDQSKWFSNVRNNLPNYALLIAPFVKGVSEGHVALVWYWQGVPYILEWIYSGLSWNFTSDYSADNWGFYEIMVPAEVWAGLNTSGGDTPLPKPQDTKFNVDHLLSVYTESLSRADAEAYFPYMLAAFQEFDISNRSRISAFLSHAVGEVGEFTYWEEIDHGNGRFGEYWGRGPLQVTWYDLYVKLRDAWLIAHPEDPVDFVENPDLVATPKYGFWTSAWYWRHGSGADLNPIADSGDFETIVQSIYGGYGYDGPYPSNYNLRWSYYNYAIKTLPANLTLGEGTPEPHPEEEDMVVSKYTFVGHGQVGTDVAGAAAYALEAVGVDTLFYNGDKSIGLALEKVKKTNDLGVANYIVIGKEAAKIANVQDMQWSEDSPVWYADPVAGDSTLSAVLFCRSWVLWWISEHGENLPASVKDKLFKVFDGALKLADEEYGLVLQKVITDNEHNPPEPEAGRVEMQVLVKDFQDDDLVSVKRKEQK